MGIKKKANQGFRNAKEILKDFLNSPDFQKERLQELTNNLKKLVSPLISFFCSTSVIERWRAITSFGWVTGKIAEENLEDGRIILRRLMWQLNDESGGIGWGCPEAMGEALRYSEKLAGEFAHILISYVDPNGNMLDNEELLKGALWGLARLAEKNPVAIKQSKRLYYQYLTDKWPETRLYAALILLLLERNIELAKIEHILNDTTPIKFYWDKEVFTTRVCDVVSKFSQ